MSSQERPLSPHLQVYKPTLTMMMSIAHRATGIILYFGFSLLVLGLIGLAAGGSFYGAVWFVATSWLGSLFLIGLTWALFHHVLGGIRHFIWDMGFGFDLVQVEKMARYTVIGSLGLTLLFWGALCLL